MSKIKTKRCTATIRVNKQKIRCGLPDGHEHAKLPSGDIDYDRYAASHEVTGYYSWEFHPEHVAGAMHVIIPAKTRRNGFRPCDYSEKYSWEHEPGNKDCPCDECQNARYKLSQAKWEAEEAESKKRKK